MKKGLSVLLIAAALFGFYGGAVNLNDVLACKDYWEAEGEKSTADMNKLEDGLNQLKDNEQAYLDGIDAVADGEEALAEGEADYADGQEALAQGEADYAKGKAMLDANASAYLQGKKILAANKGAYLEGKKTLAANKKAYLDGKKVLAANKSSYEAGKKSVKTLKGLKSSLKGAKKKYDKEWHPGLEKLKKAQKDTTKLFKSKSEDFQLIERLLGVETGSIVKSLGDAKDVNEFYDALKDVDETFSTAQAEIADMVSEFSSTAADLSDSQTDINNALKKIKELNETIAEIEDIPEDERTEDQQTTLDNSKTQKADREKTVEGTRTGAVNKTKAFKNDYGDLIQLLKESKDEEISDAASLAEAQMGKIIDSGSSDKEFAAACADFSQTLNDIVDKLSEKSAQLKTYQGMFTDYYDGFEALQEGQTAFSGSTSDNQGLPFAFKGILAKKSLADRLKSSSAALHAGIKTYSQLPLTPQAMDLETFDTHMKVISNKIIPGLITAADSVLNSLSDYEKGQKQIAKYEAGQKQIAQYESGAAMIKEYEKGKRQLAEGASKLAEGRAQLAEGAQALIDGRKELADGKERLVEYEDSEQRVRDGLADLIGTEANGGLDSILARRGDDDNFDNGNGHIELDEGLDAVQVGRGYQADAEELIAAEITKRTYGTGLGLAAGALAVLAGILSLLKKNKGAGVCAILTAIAGGAGIAVGTSAGMEFSSIAGSVAGAAPWIAFGILAGIAVVHGIVHLSSKSA